MISEVSLYEKKYGASFPGLSLTLVHVIQIPGQHVKIDYVGEKISELSPASEYLLRFIDLGVVSIEELSDALGLSNEVIGSVVMDEIELGRVRQSSTSNSFHLTGLGKETLSDLRARSPILDKSEMVFDLVTRKLQQWRTPELVADKEIRNMAKPPKAFPPSIDFINAKPQEFATRDISLFVNSKTNLSRNALAKIDILEVQKSRVVRKGSYLAKLLVWQNATADEIDFLIEIKGERSLEHEAFLRANGGLELLEIRPSQIHEAEIAEVRQAAGNVGEDESPELDSKDEYLSETIPLPDGGSVRPAEHAAFLDFALRHAKERLVIVSPWITKWVVDEQFLNQLEFLLKERNIRLLIAWGFEDKTGRHKPRRDKPAIRRLIEMSNRYEDFDFIKLDQSHIKVLLFDSTYICTSHNWLSYSGDQPRLEWGEKRTHPTVVNERFEELELVLPMNGHPTTEDDIAN